MQFLETIRVENKKASHLAYHQQRLERTLLAHNLNANYDLSGMITPPDEALYRCRILYGAEGAQVSFHSYTLREFRCLQAVVNDTVEYPYKYRDRSQLDRLFEARGECDDVIIIKNGLLTDTTIANLALYDGKQWLTPKTPLLKGTTRARLLDEGSIIESDIRLDDLQRFSKTAIMNAMVGFVEVENGIIFPK